MHRRDFLKLSALGSAGLALTAAAPRLAAQGQTRKILIAGGNYGTPFIRYMAALTGKTRPKLLYLPTASVGIAGEHLTGTEMAAAFTRALGRETRFNNVPADVYRGFGFPGADDLGNMFQFKRDFNEYYCGARNLSFGRGLNPEMQTLDVWLEKNKGKMSL